MDLDCKDWIGNTILHIACQSKVEPKSKFQMCLRLLQLPNIDINAENLEGSPPVLALKSWDIELLKLFLDQENIKLSNYHTRCNLLHCLLEKAGKDCSLIHAIPEETVDFLECIDLVVEKYPEFIHKRDEMMLLPFQVAIISRLEKAAIKLIRLATDDEIIKEKAGNYTSLSIAAGRGLLNVVRELLKRGCDPNFLDGEDNDILALSMACNTDNPKTVRCLSECTQLESLKKSSDFGLNPFEICISNNEFGILKVLIEFFPCEEFLIKDDDFNRITGYDKFVTPLTFLLRTVRHNRDIVEIVQTLLRNNKDRNRVLNETCSWQHIFSKF